MKTYPQRTNTENKRINKNKTGVIHMKKWSYPQVIPKMWITLCKPHYKKVQYLLDFIKVYPYN